MASSLEIFLVLETEADITEGDTIILNESVWFKLNLEFFYLQSNISS